MASIQQRCLKQFISLTETPHRSSPLTPLAGERDRARGHSAAFFFMFCLIWMYLATRENGIVFK